MAPKPQAPPPDDKDWTWVLTEPCPECRFDPATIRPKRLAEAVRETASRWPAVLVQPEVAQRPSKAVWSPLEYACHVRDVMRLFAKRIELMLDEDNPTFANWDQDQTARDDRLAEVLERVTKEDWQRAGTRSNGSEFTIASIGVYALHDLRHHVWDVRG
jgi:hypothetical protein